MYRTGFRSRSRAVALGIVLVTSAVFSGCASGMRVTEVVVVEGPAAAGYEPVPGVPSEVMLVGLRRFLAAASAGLPVDRLLAGDRFVVVSPVDMVEVDAGRARGDVRMLALGVPGSCGGPCRVLLGDVLSALADDVAAPVSAPSTVVAPPPLESWPSLSIDGTSRRWRVSFDSSGRGVFVVELLSGTL